MNSIWQVLKNIFGKQIAFLQNPFFHACVPPVIILMFVGYGLWGRNAEEVPLTFAIFLTGAGGGVLSNYFRLKNVPAKMIEPNAILQIYMTPAISGVLGWVMYGLFLSDMLQGALFPKFRVLHGDEYVNLAGIFDIVPENKLSAAKALLWAFVAGFSEKLIPNILDDLADQARTAGRLGDKAATPPSE